MIILAVQIKQVVFPGKDFAGLVQGADIDTDIVLFCIESDIN